MTNKKLTLSNHSETDPSRPTTAGEIHDVRKRVTQQLEAIQTHAKDWGGDRELKKATALQSLYERLEQIQRSGDGVKSAEGITEIPDLLSDLQKKPEDKLEKVRGSKALDAFFAKLNTSNNLFYLDRNLSKNELKERIGILDELYHLYKNASDKERYYMEELINRMFDTQIIPKNVQNYLDHVGSLESTVKSAGAENTNMIFVKHENVSMAHENLGKAEVLKVSKGRHDLDFTSILKLMRNMHILMLKLNEDIKSPKGQTVKVRVVADNMAIYMDNDRHYKRIVKQPFAKGRPAQEMVQEMGNEPDFKDAWKTFLQTAEDMKKSDGFVLDLTNSDAPFPKNRMHHRGKVFDTKNVFIYREKDGSWLFSVIDPDVFDTDEGEHKFDPREHADLGKNKGWLSRVMKPMLIRAMNAGRDKTTMSWQDRYMREELDK